MKDGDDHSMEVQVESTDIYMKLRSMCCDALKVDSLEIDDNFFELGANSLMLTLILSRVQDEFGSELSFPSLYESPTLRTLEELLSSDPGAQG